MLAIIRLLLIFLFSVGICVVGICGCLLFKPRFPSHAAVFGRLFRYMAPILGITVEVRNFPDQLSSRSSCIYISNHQNNYDMVTVTCAVPP